MGLGRDAGTAGSVHGNIAFREGRFAQDGIGQHADAGAQTHQLDFRGVGSGGGLELFRQQGGAKGGLADKVVCGYALQRFCHQRIQGVPLAAGDAVGYREMTTLVGFQIVVRVGILCDKDLLRAVGADLFQHLRQDGFGLFCAQRAGDKVVLHIHNDQKFHTEYLPN